ncbi:hypothetical protein FOWG_17185 [Fusarium oxysporum f. sp. lycopersici MN25]|nr:hypothetical protein FOWG_17185 [Fusarium oxysporum f. sp. lycopersici MN25]
MPPSRNTSAHEPSLSSTSQSSRAPSIGARPPYGYLQDPSNSGFEIEGFVSSYGQGYEPLGASSSTTWSKQEYEVPQLYPASQSQLPDLGQEKRLLKMTKAKRPTRKHTSNRSYNYKSHLEIHDEKREYPFPCTVDGCTKKTDLQRHHQSVHMKERNHKCDYCGLLIARKGTLRRYMEDGCSKRFDIGTLNLQGSGYSGFRIVGPARPSGYGPRREV